MTTRCQTCAGPLYGIDRIQHSPVCIECSRKELDAQIAADLAEAARRKQAGQAQASAAHPDERARVERAIRELAATGKEFSSNEARRIHGVAGPVVGATFTAARKAGLIRPVGFTTSTEPHTHAHPVRTWIGVAA